VHVDIGTVVGDCTVVEQDGEFPAWWLICSNGHRVWASTKQLEDGPKIICLKCQTDAAVRIKSTQTAIEVRELIKAEML
jgi:hypothetical protein